MNTVFISNALDADRIPFTGGGQGETLGKAHYSWQIVTDLYSSGIRAAGREVRSILRPEIYQTPVARAILGCRGTDLHFAVKPIEHLRPLPGARNAFVCGWEFPEFSAEATDSDPFKNQLAVLGKADHVVCWTDYTAANLRRHGVRQAMALPPPVLLAPAAPPASLLKLPAVRLNTANPAQETDAGRLRTFGDVLEGLGGGKVFVSVLNPFDHRKQLPAMLDGFLQAQEDHPDAVLMIKLVIDNVGTQVYNINELLPLHMDFSGVCPRVVFIGAQLSKPQVHSFLRMGAYYLCTSSAEGLNLPLIEAMLAGVPPVSTRNTAMGTYLDAQNSIGIASAAQPMPGRGHALSDHLRVTHFPPTSKDVAEALRFALKQDPEDYQTLASTARKSAEDAFGIATFTRKFNEAF